MELTTDQLQAIQACSSPEELQATASAAGYQLSLEDAQLLLKQTEYEEVNLEDLESVGGGCMTQYHCNICQGTFDGNGPHAYRRWHKNGQGEDFFVTYDVCESCYQEHRFDTDNYQWDF